MELNQLPYPEVHVEAYCAESLKKLLFDSHKWTPYICNICDHHGISLKDGIRCIPDGLEGSTPVFIVGSSHVVKFYIPIPNCSDGEEVYRSELLSFRLLNECKEDVYVPRVLHAGKMLDYRPEKDQYLYYVITKFLRGDPLSDVWPSFSRDEQLGLAHSLGQKVAQFHCVGAAERENDAQFLKFVHTARASLAKDLARKTVPQHLIDQVDAYLPNDQSLNQWIEACPHAFLHSDLHRSHIFLSKPDGQWNITGLLDWGDACFGDPFYELATIHAEIFHFDTRLLRAFLDGYSIYSKVYEREDFTYRAMVYFILYKFNHWIHKTKHKGLFKLFPEYSKADNWQQIEKGMWTLE